MTEDMFFKDMQLMFDNCKSYNEPSSPYFIHACVLEAFFKSKMKDAGFVV